jgi:hypothetical protein
MLTSTITLTRRIYTSGALKQTTVEAFANICTASFTSGQDAHIPDVIKVRNARFANRMNLHLALGGSFEAASAVR